MSTSKKTAREKAAEQRAALEAAERRRDRAVRLSIAGVVLLVLAGIAGAVLWSTRADEVPTNVALPTGVESTASGAPAGTATTPVIDIYEDFQCPACATFEEQFGPTLTQIIDEGKARVNFHPMNFLDRNLGNDSSTLAGSAFGCAINAGKTVEYHSAVFAAQPVGEGTGYTKEQLKAIGAEVGIQGADLETFNSCVDDITFGDWVSASNTEAGNRGVTSTPTMYLNDEKVDLANLNIEDFLARVDAAQ